MKTNFSNGLDYFCPDCLVFFSAQTRGRGGLGVSYCPCCGGKESLITNTDDLLLYCEQRQLDPVQFYHAFPFDELIPQSRTGATPRQVVIIKDLVLMRQAEFLPVTVEDIAGFEQLHQYLVARVFEELQITETGGTE